MKKFLIFLFILFLNTPFVHSKTLDGEISFDWISKTQMERDENILQIKNNIFSENIVKNYGRSLFKRVYKEHWKDSDYITNYTEVSRGKTEDKEKKYCGFYWKKYLISYGLQYKNNPRENFYYDALGHLKWIDRYSKEYPNFPYVSYQYGVNGKLRAVYYFLSDYDQYIFDNNGSFKGRWYKDKMYDRKANVILIRSNWE